MPRDTLRSDYLDVLVTSLLAVNSYSYDRVQALLPRMRLAKLLDPDHVGGLEPGPLTVQLYNSGYDRGLLTSRFAERLSNLMQAVRGGTLDQLPALVAANDAANASKILLSIQGVGPIVARTIWAMLCALEPRQETAETTRSD